MSECKTCGRDDGHYMGCAETPRGYTRTAPSGDMSVLIEDPPAAEDHCAFGDCENPRRPKGKGRAPMYCEDHSDPKNRK